MPAPAETAIYAIARNSTEQRQVEAELRALRSMLQQVIDSIPQQIFRKDTELIYRGCNYQQAITAGLRDSSQIISLSDFDLPGTHDKTAFYREGARQIIAVNRPQSGSLSTDSNGTLKTPLTPGLRVLLASLPIEKLQNFGKRTSREIHPDFQDFLIKSPAR